MDDAGTGAGHQGALPCRGGLRKTMKGDWQSCTCQKYRWQMDQEVGHLYALFGGPEEEEVRVKGQRLAKEWLAKARDSTKEARRCMSLKLQGASKLNGARQCRYDGPPTESRPCEGQVRAAIQRADCAWESGPRRIRELCGKHPDKAFKVQPRGWRGQQGRPRAGANAGARRRRPDKEASGGVAADV
jgi:hypothetical protein